jgi:hypothetical protein
LSAVVMRWSASGPDVHDFFVGPLGLNNVVCSVAVLICINMLGPK